jgi:RND family efflux transporter MFP subunit
MNVQQGKWSSEALEVETVDDATLARRRKRRNIIIAAAVALIAIVAAVLAFGGGGQTGTGEAPKGGAAAGGAGAGGGQLPRVSVIVPGRQQVVRSITATGTLAARRDMPVGVAGEGGKVVRVLVEPGQWVGAGQVLAIIERSVQSQEAQQLAASIQVARADARLAQQELERAQALVSRGFVSKADVERRIAARDAAVARVRVAEAQLGATQARIGRLDVRAPAAGLVLDRNVEAGQVVSSGSGALFRIAQGGEMELLARLSQEDLSRLNAGVPATVTPVGSSQTFEGRVWQVSPIIDPQTRQGDARIAVPYNSMLRPGGFASTEIRAGAIDAPLLPESAVQSDDKGNFVYVVDQKDTVVRRDVVTGDVSDQGVAIISGLNGNERVVQSAGAFLTPGQKVRPIRATAR